MSISRAFVVWQVAVVAALGLCVVAHALRGPVPDRPEHEPSNPAVLTAGHAGSVEMMTPEMTRRALVRAELRKAGFGRGGSPLGQWDLADKPEVVAAICRAVDAIVESERSERAERADRREEGR